MVKSTAMFVKLVLCLIITITIFQLSVVGDDHQAVPDHQEEAAAATYTSTPIIEKVKSMFSFFTITSATTATSCWEKAKMMAQQVNAYFFPPNLDFRGSDERGKVDEGGGGGGGAGKKVKEAVSKSWEGSKSTVEDTAKSAANLAEDTVHKTTEKIKKTLSGRSEPEFSSEL